MSPTQLQLDNAFRAKMGQPEPNDTLDGVFGDDPITHLCASQDDDKLARMETRLPPVRHEEVCPKCRGTGRYSGYSSRGSHCFACKGQGKLVFKSSAEQRAKARAAGARRKAEKAEKRLREAAAEMELWMQENEAEGLWIEEKRSSFGFAQSMHDALRQWGGLTEGQLAAVRRCMAQDAARAERQAQQQIERAEAARSAPKLDVSRIEAAFDEAKKRAARPGAKGVFTKPLRLASSEETGKLALQFRPGSEGSQWEGMLFVRTDDGKKLGHVKGGVFHKRYECTPAEQAAVVDAASDPERALLAYAKAWSRCGICGRGLLNDVSIERGIGPICASRFGFFGS